MPGRPGPRGRRPVLAAQAAAPSGTCTAGHRVPVPTAELQPQPGEGLLVRHAGWGNGEQATASTVASAEREVEGRVVEGERVGQAWGRWSHHPVAFDGFLLTVQS